MGIINAGMAKAAGAMAVAAILAGCQAMVPPPQRAPAATQQQPQTDSITGEWQTSDGVAFGRFTPDGRYELVAMDTGNRLVEGTYRRNERGIYELTGFSFMRNDSVRNNCALTTPTQLNCTAATGQHSVLVRRQRTS